MASPSDPTDSTRDPDAETVATETEKPSVEEQGGLPVDNANSDALNLESKQEETKNFQDPEEVNAKDQQVEASIEESKNEEDDMDATQAVSSSYYRRGGGPKRKKGSQKKRKQQEKCKEKLEVLLKTLNPIAFVPRKTLDFARHEKLLRILGLWDFVHLEFDQNIRQDLVANLVAYYSPEGRCSYVNDARINISRADLARALKLAKKRDLVITDEERELLENDESIKFIDEILSTWVILQRDDMWIMPLEVYEWGRYIKEKQVEKLDWAAYLWYMVETELKAEPVLGDCFFASHLQLLIKTQKEDLLRDKSKVDEEEEDGDDEVKEVEFLVKSPKEDVLEVKEENVGAADSERGDSATITKEEKYAEEHMIELNLGQEAVSDMISGEKLGPVEEQLGLVEEQLGLVEEQPSPVEEQPSPVEEQPMDVEETKKEEDERWSWNEEAHAGSHFLRRCDFSNAREEDEENRLEGPMEMGEDEPIEDVDEEETEEDKEKHEGGFPFFPNADSLHGVSQENLMLGDASPLGYNSGLQIHGNSTGGDFLTPRVDMHMGMGSGSSSLFGNGNNKREIDYENDISFHSHNPNSKRLRTEEPSWDEKPPPDDICIDQMEYVLKRFRLSLAEKNREREQAVMNQEYLMNELQSKQAMIQELERTKFEEQQRKDITIYKLESELHMMASVVEGHRKASKVTQKALREHRKCCPLRDDKPIYKDVKGSGGLVLSTTEIEKLRSKQEEEEKMTRVLIKRQIEEFENVWFKVFNDHMETVHMLTDRINEVENEVKILGETQSERKNHEPPEVVASAEEEN